MRYVIIIVLALAVLLLGLLIFRRTRRFGVAGLAVLGIVVCLGGIKGMQFGTLMAFGEAMQKAGPPPETVGTAVAQSQTWEGSVTAVGSVAPARGVTVGNEIAGTVTAIRFESGATVKQGQVLVDLDTSVERAQLNSAIARRELAVVNATRSRDLLKSGAAPKAQLDNDESALKSAIADANALSAQIERKTVRAPFTGRLGIRLVNLGQYLNVGTPISVLQAIDAVYVDFTLPQQRLADVAVGMPIRVALDGSKEAIDGTVAAIEPTVDSGSRNMKLRGAIDNKGERLRPGMFVNVAVILPQKGALVAVPATAVVHASFGDSVFVVEDKKDEQGKPVPGPDGKPAKVVRQQFVRVGEARGDFVAILDGVKVGDELVTAGAFKLRNKAGVTVNNEIKQNPSLTPTPVNH